MTLRPEHIEEALNKKTFDEIDPDEVLKHYGYKPEEVRCNGVGIGVWRKEEAFQKLGDIGAFMRFVDHLYNIMQDIGQHFRVYNIFGDYFNVLLPIDCAIQQDDTSPYYFATVQMDVTCPSMSSENNPEIEELI